MTDSILYTPSCSVNNRQTDRKADNRRCDGRCTTHTLLLREQHTDKETDKQIGRQMNRQFAVLHRRSCSVNRQTDRHRRFVTVVALHTLSCSVNKALTDTQTDTQTDSQTDRRCDVVVHQAPAAARKRSRSLCRKCRWQVSPKHTCALPMWFRDAVNWCMAVVHTERVVC